MQKSALQNVFKLFKIGKNAAQMGKASKLTIVANFENFHFFQRNNSIGEFQIVF